MKYRICWWEDNGYHDSYFYGVYFDTDDQQLHSVALGATAHAGGIGFSEEYRHPTAEIAELARHELAKIIFRTLRAAEDRDVLTPGPQNVFRGREFRLLEDYSFFLKNEKGFVKNFETGKRVKITLANGSVVSSLGDAESFGTFYANGYNRPGRCNSNIKALVTVSAESRIYQTVRIPLSKLRQHAEPLSDAAIRERARELSYNGCFGTAFGCKAWEIENWAQPLLAQAKKEVANSLAVA